MNEFDVVIVGAGMAGLAAATRLQEQGLTTVVLDKGRAPGGRMATRTIGRARFDHGAQHFSARSAEFRQQTAQWVEDGIAREWFRAASLTVDNHPIEPRHAAGGGMRRIPEHIATELRVETSITVDEIHRAPQGVTAVSNHGQSWHAAALVLTPPVPQTRQLLGRSGAQVSPNVEKMLDVVSYDACLAVMARLETVSGLPEGHLTPRRGPISWMADNQHKGVSPTPAVTIHSSPEFALANLENDPAAWAPRLAEAARPHLAGAIIDATGHRWRYSQPKQTFDIGAVAAAPGLPIVLAGEVFAGARVEGAFLSGLAAAEEVGKLL